MITGIVLAAGSSTRLGRPKQLLPLGDRTVIEHVVDRLLAAPVDRVVVVTGHQADVVAHVLGNRDVDIVVNPAFAQGQSTSLIAGIRQAAADPVCEAAIVVLGDQPGIAIDDVEALAGVWRESRPAIAMTEYGDIRSHPVMFSRGVFGEVLAVEGDRGAREVIRRHRDDVIGVRSVLAEVPADIDTEEAYSALRESWSD